MGHKKSAASSSKKKKKKAGGQAGAKRKRPQHAGGGGVGEHSDASAASAGNSDEEEEVPQRRTGWTQQDYQHEAQRKLREHAAAATAATRGAECDAAAPSVPTPAAAAPPPPPPRIGSRKKRALTPAWMLEPGEQALGAVSSAASAAAASSVSAAAASAIATPVSGALSASGLTSLCWNGLPRDCLLHVFSFFDLHAIVRLTGISHFWHACLRKGLLARVLEHSWRLMRQRKQGPAALLQQRSAQEAVGDSRRIADIVSPAALPIAAAAADDTAATGSDDVVMSLDSDEVASVVRASVPALLLLPPASPALSALQAPPPVLAALQRQHSSGAPTAASLGAPGGAYSSSSTLFKASVLHLRSLIFGQRQLSYALHSNPLFQHLSVITHLSACHEQVLEEIRRLHVALYRSAHGGKQPRSTKVEEGAAAADRHALEASAAAAQVPPLKTDLMPLHFDLDAAAHVRSAFLGELQQSQKHIFDLLQEQRPLRYGFDGSSLPLVQMRKLRTRVEDNLDNLLKQQAKQPHKGRYNAAYGGAAAAAAAASARARTTSSGLRDDRHSDVTLVHPADLPAQFVPPPPTAAAAATAASPPLLSVGDASAVCASVRRMASLAAIWAAYLHSAIGTRLIVDEAATRARKSAERHAMGSAETTAAVQAASELAAAKAPAPSPFEREWDACALLWRSHHARLQRIHLFWRSLSELLQARERSALMDAIHARAEAHQMTGPADAAAAATAAAAAAKVQQSSSAD